MALTTPAHVCNLALSRVGESEQIDDLNEASSKPASVARAVYDHVRDTLLSEMHWPFATKRTAPAALSTTRSGWAYAYQLPAECIEAQGVYSGDRNAPVDMRIPWTVEVADDLGSKLFLTDAENPEILYTARVVAVPVYPAPFVDALAWALAREFVLALPIKPELGERAEKQYLAAVQRAKAFSLREGQPDQPPDSVFKRIRG